jgi:hypothetical protein
MMCLCRHFEGGRRRRRRAKLVREKQAKPDRDNSFDLGHGAQRAAPLHILGGAERNQFEGGRGVAI